LFALAGTSTFLRHVSAADPPPAHLGYGFNVAFPDTGLLQDMGFNWIKLFGAPSSRLPQSVLVRVEANAGHLDDLPQFGAQIQQLAASHAPFVEAYEVGNEVNLDASYGWAAPPDAALYVTLLCEAYGRIKAADPTAIVVSAGLAPTGRVSGTWNGHPGHNGLYQDEREYLREFLAAGGGACADAIGYHPYGFSADYDAAPDLPSADPTKNCANGFCFRGAEKLYEVMAASGAGNKKMWATEFGWIVYPPEHCLNDPSFSGRLWQLVTQEAQADNLGGAFAFADAKWPWMGAMFVFNLNFNQATYYPECEQMRYYSVQGRPAQPRLALLPKRPAALPPRLQAQPTNLVSMVAAGDTITNVAWELLLENSGWEGTEYTITVTENEVLDFTIGPDEGDLAATARQAVSVSIDNGALPAGAYHATLVVTIAPEAEGTPLRIPVTLYVVTHLNRANLPFLAN
jgi:hypothetical protein